jgi:hypothetical protein
MDVSHGPGYAAVAGPLQVTFFQHCARISGARSISKIRDFILRAGQLTRMSMVPTWPLSIVSSFSSTNTIKIHSNRNDGKRGGSYRVIRERNDRLTIQSTVIHITFATMRSCSSLVVRKHLMQPMLHIRTLPRIVGASWGPFIVERDGGKGGSMRSKLSSMVIILLFTRIFLLVMSLSAGRYSVIIRHLHHLPLRQNYSPPDYTCYLRGMAGSWGFRSRQVPSPATSQERSAILDIIMRWDVLTRSALHRRRLQVSIEYQACWNNNEWGSRRMSCYIR